MASSGSRARLHNRSRGFRSEGYQLQSRVAFYAYYVTLYGPVAITISFLPLWIKSHGLNEQQVGQLFAFGSLLGLAINPIVGLIADMWGSRRSVLLILLGGSSAAALLLLNARSPVWVFAAYMAMQACSTALIPLSESIVLSSTTRFGLDFGRLRGIGSLSVVFVTVALGAVLDRIGLDNVVLALAFFYLIQTAMATWLPNARVVASRATKASLVQVLRLPGFVFFLCGAAVSQACHGLFYAYNAILWKSLGLSSSSIGALWSLGVLVEILTFVLGSRILARVSAPTLILCACLGGVLRWALLAEAQHPSTLIIVQLLQAATLSCTQLGAAQFIKTTVPPQAISSGTGVYAATVGILTAVTVYGGSHLYAAFGGRAFALSAVLCFGAAIATALLRQSVVPLRLQA